VDDLDDDSSDYEPDAVTVGEAPLRSGTDFSALPLKPDHYNR
jgi:hypothetical protein